jgi:polyferredoxin
MQIIQKIGLLVFSLALIIFTLMLGWSHYTLTSESLYSESDYHRDAILSKAEEMGFLGQQYGSNIAFISNFKKVIYAAKADLDTQAEQGGIPEGVNEWDFKIGDWKVKDYVYNTVKNSGQGWVQDNPLLFLFLTFGLGIIGGLLYILPAFNLIPGIKNDGIYHHALTRGLKVSLRKLFLYGTIGGIIIYGFFYMNNQWLWPAITLVATGIISYLVMKKEASAELEPQRSASPNITGWLGVGTGIYFIIFYIFLYWKPEYLTNWIEMVDPLSLFLSGNPASQWFLYGLLYSNIVLVMGIRMLAKYRHNKYQIFRTCSVMFFQLAIAFLLPEILVRLNQPWYDFKNIWPLNYTFFFDWNLDSLISSGGLGIFMLVWGILLIVIGVPFITYFFGKRWYCSWVCGCGGLAETMGDPYRQLSDKSLRAWQYERYIIHGVLVFAVVMTILVLYTYFTGSRALLFISSDTVRAWYGFLIGSAFAGVVGTGFYPLMGNRVWCRFGCPLAAYLGLVQKFKSRFRITVNGSQCISCGNCSTYCEMGIDVRWYAQRGQDIVRSSCVGCGVCSAVCPRGVLRLENASADVSHRTQSLRAIHISEDDVKLMA